MEQEEKYWSNLEKLYVHNVYEKISHQYGEFIKLSDGVEKTRDHQGINDENHLNDSTSGENHQHHHDHHHHHHHHNHAHNHTTTTTSSAGGDDATQNNGHHAHHTSTNLTLNLVGNGGPVCSVDGLNSFTSRIKQKHFRTGGGGSAKNIRHSKHSPWPKVKNFLLQLDRYSLIGKL